MTDLLKKSFLSLLLSLCFVLTATALPGSGPALKAQAAQKKAAAQKLYTDGNLTLVRKSGKIYCLVNGKRMKKAWKTIDGSTYYFDKKGEASTGVVKIGKKYYCK